MDKKEPLKEREPYKYYRNQYYGLKAGKWLSIFAPFITLAIVNFNDWFVVDEGTSVKMSIGCVLALVVGGIAFWKETKSKKGESTPVSNVVGWGIAFALCYLFSSILEDLTLIVGCGLAGQLAGAGFEFGADNRKALMEVNRNADIAAKANVRAKNELERDDGTRI